MKRKLSPVLYLFQKIIGLEKLREVLNELKVKYYLQIIEGGDHSFKLPKTSASNFKEVVEIIVKKTLSWISA